MAPLLSPEAALPPLALVPTEARLRAKLSPEPPSAKGTSHVASTEESTRAAPVRTSVRCGESTRALSAKTHATPDGAPTPTPLTSM